MGNFDEILFQVEVRETDKNRKYWASRPWARDSASDIRRAEIVVVPWENFRDGYPAVFPQETDDILGRLRVATKLPIAIGIDEENFMEISLHGRAWRWPTLFVTSVVLPVVVGVLTNRIDELIADGGSNDSIEMEVIIEQEFGRCIAIKYKGPPTRLIETLSRESLRCLPDKQKIEEDIIENSK